MGSDGSAIKRKPRNFCVRIVTKPVFITKRFLEPEDPKAFGIIRCPDRYRSQNKTLINVVSVVMYSSLNT
jgi:hypothetical protein